MWTRHIMLAVVAASGLAASLLTCSGERAPDLHSNRLWSFESKSYFSERDFLDASAFSRELAVLGDAPGTGVMFGVHALDAKTGTELWHKSQLGWLLHPPHATTPLYFAPGDSSIGYTHVDRLDARTGDVVATIPILVPGDTSKTTISWSPRGPLVLGNGVLMVLDWTTGQPLWSKPVETEYVRPPTIVGDSVVVPGATTRAFALADGASLATIDGACCGVATSPDGRHVFVEGEHETTIELDADLHVVKQSPGTVVAVSNTHYAIETYEENGPRTLHIYAYGALTASFVLVPTDPHDRYTAIALDGDELFYVHAADATLYERNLTTSTTHMVDHVGSSRGLRWTSPIIERPYLFTQLGERSVYVYLIGQR